MISAWKQAPQLCLVKIARRRGSLTLAPTPALPLAAVVALLCLGACGSSSTTVKSIAISPTSATVNIAQQVTFTAVVTLTDSTVSTTTTVTWEVNGSTSDTGCGSIAASPDDQLEGIYTAPAAVPSATCGVTGGTLGQVAITAVTTQTGTSSSSSSSSTSGTVTSNTAVVTVGVVLGLTVSPVSAAVPAGGSQQFSALLNGLASGASWTLTPAASTTVNPGTIDSNGVYTAPPFPPPGNSVTVTATVTGSNGSPVTATATITISYSDQSLSGPYAFSYAGNDGSGFFAVTGSFVADGNGNIVSGIEDIQSFLTGISTAVPIMASTYSVGSDGRGSASIKTNRGTATWRFALSTNLHAELTRFDTNTAGGGTIDQQTLNATTNSSLSVISGRYTFELLGLDGSSNPLGVAAEFSANGSGGIPNTNAILDYNDNDTVTRADTTLTGSYSFDAANAGTGRGTLTLQSAAFGVANPRTFTFYAVGTTSNCTNQASVCQLHLIETDGLAFTAGDIFLAAASPGLADATYVFTTGGGSSGGAYAAGGVFASDGVSSISSGTLDINNAGTYNQGESVGPCGFSVDSTTGRIDVGPCSSTEFAGYPTALGSVALLQIDPSAVSAGLAYQQCGPQSTGCAASSPTLSAVSIDLGLTGQGLFHSPPASSSLFQPDLDGQVSLSAASVTAGNLDINNFTGTFPTDPIGTTGTSIGSPTAGRGTLNLAPTNPSATYNLVYYLIDDHTALLFSSGQSPVAIGTAARQF
jgi:hypothetical protein